jgi:hypothetical protein
VQYVFIPICADAQREELGLVAMDIYVPNHAIYYTAISAILTSSAKLVAWVFFILLALWTSTVRALMPSS